MATPWTHRPPKCCHAPSQRKYWTRKGTRPIGWSALLEGAPLSLIGIDHGFSFPLRYFETYHIPPDWQTFLDDFHAHWPTDEDNVYVDFVRDGSAGNGASRFGRTRWKRITEERSGSAKSVFHFDVPGSVAKSTHSGIPWLRFIRQQVGARVHFWPFDGWEVPDGQIGSGRGIPILMAECIRQRRAHTGSARRLLRGRLDARRRC
jgi:hypothetical protein